MPTCSANFVVLLKKKQKKIIIKKNYKQKTKNTTFKQKKIHMPSQLAELIIEHSGELITFFATSLIAFIKRKIDLKRLKREGKI